MKDYHINIFYSDEDKCYVAEIPDLFSCTAFGITPEAALRELRIAKELWLESAKDLGKPIPQPRYRAPAHERIGGREIRSRSTGRANRHKPQRAGK